MGGGAGSGDTRQLESVPGPAVAWAAAAEADGAAKAKVPAPPAPEATDRAAAGRPRGPEVTTRPRGSDAPGWLAPLLVLAGLIAALVALPAPARRLARGRRPPAARLVRRRRRAHRGRVRAALGQRAPRPLGSVACTTATATVDTDLGHASSPSAGTDRVEVPRARRSVLDLMTDDIVYDDSASPETMRGKDDVRRFLEQTWRAFPDLEFEAVGAPLVADDGPRAAVLVEGHRHQHRPDRPARASRPTGKRVEFEGADFHEYRDGKVARLRIVFDMTDLSRQLGLMPEPGKRGARRRWWPRRRCVRSSRLVLNHNMLCFGKE